MTNFTKTLMLAAAACTIAAGSAAAQTYQAEIPFTFRAGNSTLAPGRYAITVSHMTVGKFLMVRAMDTRKSILLQLNGATGERRGESGAMDARLRFECGASRCALKSMWVGGYQGSYTFPTPALGRNETARIETVELARAKAD
jgi:hypothetical protein